MTFTKVLWVFWTVLDLHAYKALALYRVAALWNSTAWLCISLLLQV